MIKKLAIWIAPVLLVAALVAPSWAQGGVFARVQTLPMPSGLDLQDVKAPRISPQERRRACHPVERSTVDRPDERAGRLVHVVYLLPSDGRDRHFDTDGTLDCSLRSMNKWFLEQTGDLEWRIDTFTDNVGGKRVETVDVTFVRTSTSSDEWVSPDDELLKLGFVNPEKRYLSFVATDGAGACGDAWYPIDTSSNPVDGQYSQVYVEAPPGCHTRDFGIPGKPSWSEGTSLQELLHNDGIVPIGAPHTCTLDLGGTFGHLCTGPLGVLAATNGAHIDPERFDVMFPFVYSPLSTNFLDAGNDDYFRHSFPFRDLENAFYLEKIDG